MFCQKLRAYLHLYVYIYIIYKYIYIYTHTQHPRFSVVRLFPRQAAWSKGLDGEAETFLSDEGALHRYGGGLKDIVPICGNIGVV